jgi:hypothetical protein
MVAVNCAGGWTTDPNNQVTPFARLSDPFPGNGGDGPLSPPGNSLGALNDVGFGGAGNSMSLFKEFSLAAVREGMRMEVRIEAFNAFIRPQFCRPDTSLRFEDGQITGSFGQITSTCNSPREVQMALKLYWRPETRAGQPPFRPFTWFN